MTAEDKASQTSSGDDHAPSQQRHSVPTRYFGTVEIGADRAMRDFGTIADSVLAHLLTQRGAKIRLRLEIDAELANGFTPEVVRTVTENGSHLNFTQQGFEGSE